MSMKGGIRSIGHTLDVSAFQVIHVSWKLALGQIIASAYAALVGLTNADKAPILKTR